MARYKSPAIRRYVIRIAVLMSFYLVALFGATYAVSRRPGVGSRGLSSLAVIPALPVIGVFWAVMRLLVEEPDEFMRLMMVRQALIATGFCLTVMTIWEFLQNFDLVAARQWRLRRGLLLVHGAGRRRALQLGDAWARRATAHEQSPQGAPRGTRLEPVGPRRSARRVAAERQCDRDGQIRSLAAAGVSHRRTVRPGDRGYLRVADPRAERCAARGNARGRWRLSARGRQFRRRNREYS